MRKRNDQAGAAEQGSVAFQVVLPAELLRRLRRHADDRRVSQATIARLGLKLVLDALDHDQRALGVPPDDELRALMRAGMEAEGRP